MWCVTVLFKDHVAVTCQINLPLTINLVRSKIGAVLKLGWVLGKFSEFWVGKWV